jgi:hypothetical protein
MLARSLVIIEHTFVNQPRPSVTVFWEREFATDSYAHSGEASIAYQTLGDGPCDLVLVTGPASHMELLWEEPRTARTFRTMAGFADRGDHVLRGVPDPWRLYALER